MGKERTNFSSMGDVCVKGRACLISELHSLRCSTGLRYAWTWDLGEMLWCSSAAGCPKEAFLQKSPFCFILWDFTTAELLMKLNNFSYLCQGNTLRGFLKVNPAFITSCSLLDNLSIILLLLSPVEMKLPWMGMGLMEAEIQTAGYFYSWKRGKSPVTPNFLWIGILLQLRVSWGLNYPEKIPGLPIPSAVLCGMFSFRKTKPRSAEIHKMTNSKNFITSVHACICKSCAKGSSGYRTNPDLYFVHRKTYLQHTILSVSRHDNDCP